MFPPDSRVDSDTATIIRFPIAPGTVPTAARDDAAGPAALCLGAAPARRARTRIYVPAAERTPPRLAADPPPSAHLPGAGRHCRADRQRPRRPADRSGRRHHPGAGRAAAVTLAMSLAGTSAMLAVSAWLYPDVWALVSAADLLRAVLP